MLTPISRATLMAHTANVTLGGRCSDCGTDMPIGAPPRVRQYRRDRARLPVDEHVNNLVHIPMPCVARTLHLPHARASEPSRTSLARGQLGDLYELDRLHALKHELRDPHATGDHHGLRPEIDQRDHQLAP